MMLIDTDSYRSNTVAGSTSKRLESIDLLRGTVMIVMALDHVRDFVGVGNPSDLVHGTTSLFFTRWITDFCAPVFFLLTGTGAYLSRARKDTKELSRFLFTRGIWLIFLEVFVVRCLGWQFNFDYHITMLTVLWALGWSMICLAGMVHLPASLVAGLGFLMVVSHNLLDRLRLTGNLWSVLHSPGFLMRSPDHIVFVAYPLVPWIGVMALGYGLGKLYDGTFSQRRFVMTIAGALCCMGFLGLRAMNHYGDPQNWSSQTTAVKTTLSFLDATKYPPSLLFLLMTLGPALLVLAAFDRSTPALLRPALIFGKVPMFYYLLHVPTIHVIALLICLYRYHDVHWMFHSARLDQFPVARPPGWGLPLAGVYLIWLLVVILMYPLCVWFADVKRRGRSKFLGYL